jgi:hypothetical protein
MSDKPDRQDLEDRVDQLETTIAKMLPGRRDALKLGGAALLGGAAMSGSASAGGNEAGTIGTAGAPVDVEVEDINPGSSRSVSFSDNDITGVSSLTTDDISVTEATNWTAFPASNTSLPLNTFTTFPLDNVTGDDLGEVNTSSNEFTPQRSGRYYIRMSCFFFDGSAGDGITMKIQDVTNSNTVEDSVIYRKVSQSEGFDGPFVVDLTGGDSYQMQVKNRDNSDGLNNVRSRVVAYRVLG